MGDCKNKFSTIIQPLVKFRNLSSSTIVLNVKKGIPSHFLAIQKPQIESFEVEFNVSNGKMIDLFLQPQTSIAEHTKDFLELSQLKNKKSKHLIRSLTNHSASI